MSVREVQTAAARVFHVDRLSDTAIQELKSRFRYHPLDLEALFSAPVEPSFSTYGDYGFMTLLWPEALTQDVRAIRFFVDQHQLTIVGDTEQQDIATAVAELHTNLGSTESQLSAPELVHEFLQRLRQAWKPGLQPTPTAQHRFTGNAQAVRQLGRWLQSINLKTVVPQLIIDAHTLDSIAERKSRVEQPVTRQPQPALPKVLRAYALVSVVMVLVVIATLAVQ